MKPLVSVLIPAYNAEKWIRETITSALNQTWRNKEIIIIDDGSSDHTLHVAREFESKSVKVILQENRGAANARNTALSYAQGEYIQWLDADDLLAPDKISQQLAKNDGGQDSNILLTASFGTFFFYPHRARFIPTELWKDLNPEEWLMTKFNNNVWMNPTSWLVSRRLVDMAGPWNEKLSYDDDGEYCCRIVAHSKKILFMPDSRCYYRIGNLQSLSNVISDKALDSLLLSISLCINHLLSLEDSSRTRSACIKYLQHRISYFYPDKHEWIKRANDLAIELGGQLELSEESRKFRFIGKIVGYNRAKYLKGLLWMVEIVARKNWDRLFHLLSSQRCFR